MLLWTSLAGISHNKHSNLLHGRLGRPCMGLCWGSVPLLMQTAVQ